MVEIRYRDYYEVADLAGQSVAEAREHFKAEFDIPNKAKAKMNGKKVNTKLESETRLNDDDKLVFAEARGKGAYLVGSLLLALAITGGVFAFGWINATTTLTAGEALSDFASVSTNTTTSITWSPYGFYKGSVPIVSGNGTSVFNVDTDTSNYDGDLVVTVSLANADTLAKCYRVLAFKVMMYTSSDNIVDINEDNEGIYGDEDDYALLTLGNGEVNLFPEGVAGGDEMTVRIKSGFYITHIWKAAPWDTAVERQPELFCEVAQR